jgi:chemotaxis protein CheX
MDVWSQTLELPLVQDVGPPGGWSSGSVVGSVQLTGTWAGTVFLQCVPGFATRAAECLFGVRSQPPSWEDALDTLGELTNIISGNLKSILSTSGCQMSMPSVIEGASAPVVGPGGRVVACQAFRCEDASIVVTVVKSTR